MTLSDLLAAAKSQKITLIGWGAGDLCKRLLPLLGLKVRVLIDRNEGLWDQSLHGLTIGPPSLLDDMNPAETIIVIFSEYLDEIRQSITVHGNFPTIPALSAMSVVPAGNSILYGRAALLSGDYVSPELDIIIPDSCFPNKIAGDLHAVKWEYARSDHPHAWNCDRRYPGVGLLNRDELHVLYNSAKLFAGKRGLEVGAWVGWSACHVALAGIELDVIDPFFARWWLKETVEASLTAAGIRDRVTLHTGYSPAAVADLAPIRAPWSFIFIDGDHEGDAPRLDAAECRHHAAADALILFHDLASPDVSAGLDLLADHGWNTMIYDTAQIMGVAWRGNVTPIAHQPDPSVTMPLPAHLARHPVSGRSEPL